MQRNCLLNLPKLSTKTFTKQVKQLKLHKVDCLARQEKSYQVVLSTFSKATREVVNKSWGEVELSEKAPSASVYPINNVTTCKETQFTAMII